MESEKSGLRPPAGPRHDPGMRVLTADQCRGLDPRMFVVDHGSDEKLSSVVAKMLDPVDPVSMHCWVQKREIATELHHHEHDEYWLWSAGRTRLTLRLPDGRSDSLVIGPGWVVYCVRGVEHGHEPLADWACFECVSMLRDGAHVGHLHRA